MVSGGNVLQLRLAALRLMHELERRQAQKFSTYFPDCKPECKRDVFGKPSMEVADHVGYCRCLYVQHTRWMAAGIEHNERLFMAANQIGKTETAAFEVTCHLTGRYPHWWEGYRFVGPTDWWVAGDTMLSTRDVLQVALMGPIDGVETGTWRGMIPPYYIGEVTRRSGGVSLCLDKVWVSHVDGGKSSIEFKSYDQGRRTFQGPKLHGIWLDEEPPDPPVKAAASGEGNDIYTECLLRTINTGGMVIATFTPLRGLTPFIAEYLNTAQMLNTEGELAPAKEVFWPEKATA